MNVGNLGGNEQVALIEFLVHHMSIASRNQLMTELPVIYGKLYPDVAPELIGAKVVAAINQARATAVQRAKAEARLSRERMAEREAWGSEI